MSHSPKEAGVICAQDHRAAGFVEWKEMVPLVISHGARLQVGGEAKLHGDT